MFRIAIDKGRLEDANHFEERLISKTVDTKGTQLQQENLCQVELLLWFTKSCTPQLLRSGHYCLVLKGTLLYESRYF